MLRNDLQVKAISLPAGKSKAKFSAGAGLYLLINRSGKYWRYDYKLSGKRREASLGVYLPGSNKHLSLKAAKVAVNAVKDLVAAGIDPIRHKRAEREAEQAKAEEAEQVIASDVTTFEVVAREWHETHAHTWSPKHASTILRRFELHVFPSMGETPLSKLTRAQCANTITAIAKRGTVEIAKRIAQITRQVLEYACDRGLIDGIPMGNMKNLLPSRKATPMPAITEAKRIGELLRAIYAYEGSYVVCQALKLLPLLAVRSGEFRTAHWNEFDLEGGTWVIPAAHRKLTKALKEDSTNTHTVPLSTQAVCILRDLRAFTGSGNHVFPSMRGDTRPMSENTVNVAIHAMGFRDMCGHGWRAVFSTTMNEQGFNPDAIERQLAHTEKNAVRAAYNRSDYMDERTAMMQHWANYLNGLL